MSGPLTAHLVATLGAYSRRDASQSYPTRAPLNVELERNRTVNIREFNVLVEFNQCHLGDKTNAPICIWFFTSKGSFRLNSSRYERKSRGAPKHHRLEREGRVQMRELNVPRLLGRLHGFTEVTSPFPLAHLCCRLS